MDYFGFLKDFWWAVVAAVVLGVLVFLTRRWLRNRPGMSGHWKATFTSKDQTTNEEDIYITAWFGYVWGSSTCTWKEGTAERSVRYAIRGRYREKTIVATYTAESNLDMGVFIVRIKPGGTVGNGIITSYDSPTTYDEFDFQHLDASTDYSWKKVLRS